MRITRWIFALIVVGQTITLGIGTYLIYRSNRVLMREQFAARAESKASDLGQIMSRYLCDRSVAEAKKYIEDEWSHGRITFGKLRRGSSELISVGDQAYLGADFDSTHAVETLEQKNVYVTFAEVSPCKVNEEPIELQMGVSFAGLETPLRILLYSQVEVLAAQLFLLFVGLVILGRILDQNIETVVARCEKIAKGDLSHTEYDHRNNEFTVMIETLEQMCDSLSKVEQERDGQKSQLMMASKMTALGEMAGGIAHEINNPLAIIRGRCHMMLRKFKENGLAGEANDDLLRDLEIIDKTTDRIAKIIRGLRSFSRDESGDPLENVPINTIVQDTLGFCRSRFRDLGVKLIVNEVPGHLTLECRPAQIGQVLLNLLNNAFDAIEGSHEPWVSLEVVANSSEIQIVVTDSGSGIPQEIREKVLQPFFTTKAVGKGTGLGLSISSGIVKSHQGSITIDAECPHTRFVVRLPIKQNTQSKNVA